MNMPKVGTTFSRQWLDDNFEKLNSQALSIAAVDAEKHLITLSNGKSMTPEAWELLVERGAFTDVTPPAAPAPSGEVKREPFDAEQFKREVDEMFVFAAAVVLPDQYKACQRIQKACRNLALLLVELLPEGNEQIVCRNTLLSVALWARHAIARRQVMVAAANPPWVATPPVAETSAKSASSPSPTT